MRNFFSRRQDLIARFLNTLYPSQCPVCGNSPDVLSLSPICSPCWSQIKRYKGPSCKICALPFSSEYSTICGQCLKKPPPFSKVMEYGLYEGVLAEAINQIKFHGLKRPSKPLGRLMLSLDFPDVDGIVPVPLTIKGLRARGFNQSLLIANVLSEEMRTPLLTAVLFKKKETHPQIGLSAKERLLNLKNAFETKGNIKDMSLLLVDDVMTTGATVTECSKVLMKAGAREVFVLVLARAGIT